MKSFFQAAAFAASASAAVLRRDTCCFQITASGDVSGTMGQLSDGQNRLNSSLPAATYCYSNGGITDSEGRGCVVTYTNDATHQFQCDLNSAPTYGFSIASTGTILYEGSDQFYACPATDTTYNVYTTWLTGQDKCEAITLSTNGTCVGGVSSGTSSSEVPVCSAAPAETSAAGSSVAAYTSAEETTPAVQITTAVQATTSAISAALTTVGTQAVSEYSASSVSEVYTATPVASYSESSVAESVSAYTASSAVVESTPVASVSAVESTVAASVPAVESTVAASVPVESTPVASAYSVQSTPAAVSSYSAYSVESYSSPVASSYEAASTAVTTYYTTFSTSVFTSIASALTPVESATSISAYSAPSSVVSASSVAVAYSSSVSIPTYSFVSSASVVAYSSTPAQASTSQVAVTSQAQTSIPSYGTSTSIIVSSTPAASTSAIISSTSVASTPAVSSSAAATATGSTCQTSIASTTTLSGTYQTPHLIVPINSDYPDTAYGTQYDAYINSTTSTIFNFDIPSSYSGMTCSLVFLFPPQADLETSSYTFSGSGDLVFTELSGVATQETTYDNAPAVESTLDTVALATGNSYIIATGACASDTTISYEVSSSGGLSLEFFEDWNPSSLGLFITAC